MFFFKFRAPGCALRMAIPFQEMSQCRRPKAPCGGLWRSDPIKQVRWQAGKNILEAKKVRSGDPWLFFVLFSD